MQKDGGRGKFVLTPLILHCDYILMLISPTLARVEQFFEETDFRSNANGSTRPFQGSGCIRHARTVCEFLRDMPCALSSPFCPAAPSRRPPPPFSSPRRRATPQQTTTRRRTGRSGPSAPSRRRIWPVTPCEGCWRGQGVGISLPTISPRT